MAVKITLRKKPISGGRLSLYLDFYPAVTHPETGKETRREFLKMYIYEPIKYHKRKNSKGEVKETPVFSTDFSINEMRKKYNSDQMMIAENIRHKRENYYNKPEIYQQQEREMLKRKKIGQQSFNQYFEQLGNKRTGSTRSTWHAALKFLNQFEELKFADITERKANEFRERILKSDLHQNTALSYFNKFKATLKEAYRAGKLEKDINEKIETIPEAETIVDFLTVDELNELIKTPCKDNVIKRAALFTALTGLRFVDVKNLLREQLEIFEDGYYLRFTQQKTKKPLYHPIPEQAVSLMDKSGWLAFDGLRDATNHHYKAISQWVKDAGINKHISYNCFRHTFAVTQLANGTDIYTVSKLMGHTNIKTTQRYAQIVDSVKRDAINRIKLNL